MRGELAERVEALRSVDAEAFQREVESDARVLRSELAEGTFDNPRGNVGLEYEFYAVADGSFAAGSAAEGGQLARLPRRLLDYVGFEKELGLHNAELSTTPEPLNGYGLAAQEDQVRARLASARDALAAEDLRLVSDGLWAIPPVGETAREYVTDAATAEGVRLGANMAASPRYHAMSQSDAPGRYVDAPHVSLSADVVAPESLITSIQPHYQVPVAEELPAYFRYALRVAAPLLALGVNSPFFPPDLYDDGVDPRAVLADGWHEHRIDVFETTMNPADADPTDERAKVRFPEDVASIDEAIQRIVDDETIVPMPIERGQRFDDAFAAFRTKHGTFWRWVRPVFGGASRAEANARIEFRPLPAQPTVRDTVGFQAAFAGLVAELYRREHPLAELDWATARENFYAAARGGLDAELVWIDDDGRRTTDTEAIYREVFAHAEAGLQAAAVPGGRIDRYLGPLRDRVAAGVTPAAWKRREVERRLEDGDGLAAAITGMQRAYLAHQEATLLEGSFADWLE